ncbi:MAG: hypothetical protein ACRDSE_20820 [Pseudonocardiaceae bacterium]
MPTTPEPPHWDLIAGADPARTLDALFVSAPLRDYAQRPRVNDFTLPVLGMGYLATYAAAQGFNVGVLDAEAHGLGIDRTIRIVNNAAAAPGSVTGFCAAPSDPHALGSGGPAPSSHQKAAARYDYAEAVAEFLATSTPWLRHLEAAAAYPHCRRHALP